MFGEGLVQGLAVTLGEFFHKKETIPYPEQQRAYNARVRGRLTLDPEKCIGCSQCARACPNKVLKVETTGKGKERRLSRYTVAVEYCLFCGLCTEACPTKALCFVPTAHKPSLTRYGPQVLYAAGSKERLGIPGGGQDNG